MGSRLPVTLQINVQPLDFPCVRHTLPHQLRQLAELVDEVILTFDLRRSSVGYSQTWEDRRPLLRDLLHDCRARYSNVRILEVDYSPHVEEALSVQFLGRHPVPHADARGGPFYAYLYGLHSARNEDILHLDGTIITGGSGAEGWLKQARELFESRRDVVGCSPLPGPPAADGGLREPAEWWKPDNTLPGGYRFTRYTLRAVFIQRARLMTRTGALRLRLAAPLHALRGWTAGHPPYRELDVTLTHAMTSKGLVRLAFPGPSGGFWTLHPRLQMPTVIGRLPEIVRDIEMDRIPEAQRGNGELDEALEEWGAGHSASHAVLAHA